MTEFTPVTFHIALPLFDSIECGPDGMNVTWICQCRAEVSAGGKYTVRNQRLVDVLVQTTQYSRFGSSIHKFDSDFCGRENCLVFLAMCIVDPRFSHWLEIMSEQARFVAGDRSTMPQAKRLFESAGV